LRAATAVCAAARLILVTAMGVRLPISNDRYYYTHRIAAAVKRGIEGGTT